MRKIFLLVLLFLGSFVVNAQLLKQSTKKEDGKQVARDWYNCSFEEDGIYGAEVNRAHEFLKGKKLKKNPIVAVIGFGMDVEHEDLKASIWTNKREKKDGKDNDKNGLIDDIYGWNFIGGKDGQVMEGLMREGDREFLRLKELYADYITSDGHFFKIIDGKRTEVPAPANMKEYTYYKQRVMAESELAKTYGGWQYAYVIKEYAQKFKEELAKRFPGKKILYEDFQTCYNPQAPQDSLRDIAFTLIAMGFQMYKTKELDVVYKNFVETVVENGKESYEKAFAKYGNDNRKNIVGDNYLDIKDQEYGNDVLLTSDAGIGTMQAGIIAAQRENKLGIDGIIDQAQIMTLRVSTGVGEPYLKDMVLAIRYAVDHGADVIILPEQNSLYPEEQKRWMCEALRYAESKGVLVIVPVWDLSMDLSQHIFFPNRWMDGEKELTNLLVVASSDKEGNPSIKANYGMKELDLFAPGIDIYSSYTGDSYKKGTGGNLAAATVAGVAALIKAYYPSLTGSQIRALLNENVTSREGVEVEKMFLSGRDLKQDVYLFDELCLSGGIVNAYKAVIAADALAKQGGGARR